MRLTLNRAVFIAAIAHATVWAGTKPTVRVDDYLRLESVAVTNDTLVVSWSYAQCLPTDRVFVKFRDGADGEWTDMPHTALVGDLSLTIPFPPEGTNFEYFVYTDHVPVQPVHTNGVYVAGGWHSPTNAIYVPVLTGAREDGREIAPIREQED